MTTPNVPARARSSTNNRLSLKRKVRKKRCVPLHMKAPLVPLDAALWTWFLCTSVLKGARCGCEVIDHQAREVTASALTKWDKSSMHRDGARKTNGFVSFQYRYLFNKSICRQALTVRRRVSWSHGLMVSKTWPHVLSPSRPRLVGGKKITLAPLHSNHSNV